MSAIHTQTGRTSERGAILVQVAISLLVLMGLSTFVIDYGVLWLSRGQAQDAADAGALAGAIARAYDDFANPPAVNGKTDQSAHKAAQANDVWNAAPTTQVSFNCPAGVAGSCVKVDVYRDGRFGSTTLPSLFGNLLNISSQGVWATATARFANANTTNCMRPWAVADKWTHVVNPALEYDHWTKQGNNLVELDPHDNYIPADASGPGTGFHLGPPLPDDRGAEQILKVGNASSDPITPGWFLAVDLPDGVGGYLTGGNNYRANIASCLGNPVRIGDYLPTETGNMVGPTRQGFLDLVATDPNASWNGTTVAGSCAPTCAGTSPRIVPIAIFDIDDFQRRNITNDWSVCPGGGSCIHVVNILGYFVDHMQGQDVVGYLMTLPGEFVTGGPSVGGGASFLTVIQLVR